MVIGSGDLASVLPEREDLIFFASGVSDSSTTDKAAFRREANLLRKQDRTQHLVYFSSIGVLTGGDTPYYHHKFRMEGAVQADFPHHTIVRLGNITWGKNPHTLINYLRAHPKAEIRDEWRYIVDKDEFLYWINLIPTWPCEMMIVGRRMKVKQIKEYYA